MKRIILVVILMAIALPVVADGGKHKDTTTTYAETTTTYQATTTTEVVLIEVCLIEEEKIIFIPPEEFDEEIHERIFHDGQRRHCLPKVPTPTVTTLPSGPHVTFPPTTAVGSDPLPPPEIPDIPRDWEPTTTIPLEYVTMPGTHTLPFTGIPVWAWAVVAVIVMGGGIALLRSIEEDE